MSRVYARKATAILYIYKRKMMSSKSTAAAVHSPGKLLSHSNIYIYIYQVLTVHPQFRARSGPMDATEDNRQFRFKESLEYFRSLSKGDQNDSAYGSTSDLVLASPELQTAQSDGTTSHWNTMHLYEFISCGGDYVSLFQSQLDYFVKCGVWDRKKVSCTTAKNTLHNWFTSDYCSANLVQNAICTPATLLPCCVL